MVRLAVGTSPQVRCAGAVCESFNNMNKSHLPNQEGMLDAFLQQFGAQIRRDLFDFSSPEDATQKYKVHVMRSRVAPAVREESLSSRESKDKEHAVNSSSSSSPSSSSLSSSSSYSSFSDSSSYNVITSKSMVDYYLRKFGDYGDHSAPTDAGYKDEARGRVGPTLPEEPPTSRGAGDAKGLSSSPSLCRLRRHPTPSEFRSIPLSISTQVLHLLYEGSVSRTRFLSLSSVSIPQHFSTEGVGQFPCF